MNADRVKDTTTTTGTGSITVSGTPPAGFQALSAVGSVGATFTYAIAGQTGSEWEIGTATITAANVFSRSVTASSNANALVNFSAGTKDVFCTLSAAQIAKFNSTSTAAFALAIPLTTPGTTYMPQQTVASVLAFTVGASPVQGALVYVRLVADGTNVPTFIGFKEWGGSSGYDNRNGIANQVQFFYDGYDYFYSVSQAVGAVAVDATAPTLSSPTSTQTGTTTASGTVMTDEANGTLFWLATTNATETSATVIASGASQVITSTGSKTVTSTGLTPSTTYYLHYAHRDAAGNVAVNATNSASFTTAATATAPATMAAPTASGGDTVATVTLVAPADGGSAITGYTVTSMPAGMTDTNAGTTSLTHAMTGGTNGQAYTFTAKATNAVGTAATASPASNSVTLAAAAMPRLIGLANLTETGTGPYGYNFATNAGFSAAGGALNLHLPSTADGSFAVRNVGGKEFILEITTSTSPTTFENFSTAPFALWTSGTAGGNYGVFIAGTAQTVANTVANAANDIMRIRRSGTSWFAEVARAASPTVFTTIFTKTGAGTGQLGFGCNTQACSFDTLTCVGMV
jgi:hypothetical protein